MQGELGVVSGTALALVLARRLQTGDPDGAMRRALAHFPFPAIAERVLVTHFAAGGKPASAPFALSPMPSLQPGAALTELTVAAGFAEMFLAKEGHAGLVGINLLEKIQLHTLPTLFGAMLADVDYVLVGAGIPRAIPGILDRLAAGEPVADFLRKGGELAETAGRKCLCNGLAATVGLGQTRHGESEPALVTAGNEFVDLARLFRAGASSYTAADVLNYLRGVVTSTAGLPVGCEAL